MPEKEFTLNAFGAHGSIVRNPEYIFYVVNKGKQSERYGDHGLPSRTDEGLDHMIEWIYGNSLGSLPIKKNQKPYLVIINIPRKRKLKKGYGTRGENAIIELKYKKE
jgi:hypothetical protein